MSGVVLRCPNCGTTRTTPGECEACHEAQVRYHCTTHTPGRWLDTPSCPQCGARFGEPISTPVRPVRTTSTREPVRPAPAVPVRKPSPAPRPARAPAARPEADEDARGRPAHLPRRDDDEIDGRDAYAPRGISWRDLLRHAARARRVPTDAVFDRETASPGRPRLGGCLGRFILILVFLFLALTGGVFVLGGSLLRLFLPF